ncbi:unnamed protein product [Adineta steineri]|uniref:Uncharacterized protein n=1 Tax=Adineta steineri TaxID=433720 RepID=A0A815Z3X0_9BILA|nr:unnamed protein product [Adineta steineri]CAF1577434.1 unnamed protein product [Adineta steineri]CAF1580298.1 unnamed protein product [Adineta steineri]
MQVSEKILLIVSAIVAAISALFCIIGLTTPAWTLNYGLWCSYCPSSPSQGLSIVAFILLVISVIVLVLFLLKVLPKSIRIVVLIVLVLAGIFTLAAFAAYFDGSTGYSYKLMVVAHFLCYIASVVAAFWLGATYSENIGQAA